MREVVLMMLLAVASSSAMAAQLEKPKNKGFAKLTKIEQRWHDGHTLALNTDRIARSPLIASLQSIKRDLDGVQVSECLKEAKIKLNEYMELSINYLLSSISYNSLLPIDYRKQLNDLDNETVDKAGRAHDNYISSKNSCS